MPESCDWGINQPVGRGMPADTAPLSHRLMIPPSPRDAFILHTTNETENRKVFRLQNLFFILDINATENKIIKKCNQLSTNIINIKNIKKFKIN